MKKLSKELSTKVIRLDIDIILKNYNKPEFWKKEWLIYKSNLITLYAKINCINIRKNYIEMNVYTKQELIKCKKLNRNIYCPIRETYFIIPIDHIDYSKDKFKNDLLSSCIKIIRYIEDNMIEKYSEYIHAFNLKNDYRDKLEEIANDFLDDNNVFNKDIRSAYIDNYIFNSSIPDYTGDVLSNYKYTVIPYEYLMITAFFDDNKKYEEYSKLCHKIRKSTRIKLWLEGRKLDTDEFVEEMKDLLEDI